MACEDTGEMVVRLIKDVVTGDSKEDKEKMRVYIDISQSTFTHFSNEAKEQGIPVSALISGEVEALYCKALEEKWREEDLAEENAKFLERSFGEDDDEW